MRVLVDANVLSEPTRAAPSLAVVAWLRANEQNVVVDPIVLGELRFGIERLSRGKRRARLELWFDEAVRAVPCLDFTAETALTWARLLTRLKANGRAMPIKDSLIAATALTHAVPVATRNVRDFESAGVEVIDPFAGSS